TSMASAVVVGAAAAGGVPVRKYSPMCRLAASVNQTLPFGPAVIPVGLLAAVGTLKSVTWPAGVIRPIWLASGSVNQRLPSGPAEGAVRAARAAVGGAGRVRGSGD